MELGWGKADVAGRTHGTERCWPCSTLNPGVHPCLLQRLKSSPMFRLEVRNDIWHP